MLKVHVLNVGHGDCIVVEFPSGRLSVVDINRSVEMDSDSFNEIISGALGDNSVKENLLYKLGLKTYGQLLQEAKYNIVLTDPIKYIKSICPERSIFRFISTHPHMDHLTGLKTVHNEFRIANFWVAKNDFEPDINKLSDSEKEDWDLYRKFKNEQIEGVRIINPLADIPQQNYWKDDGIYVLAPNKDTLSNSIGPNNISYVLLIIYGKSKVILGGDAESNIWEHLLKSCPSVLENVTLLKASHHGRDSGYHQAAVKLMNPSATVISVGKKPESDASDKYGQYSKLVLSTRWYGTIRFELNEDGTGKYYPEYERN